MPQLIDELADQQYGVVARAQALALGATRSWLAVRVRGGRWQRPYPGTYVVFTGPMPFPTRVMAAVLRAGPGAMACGLTAAALHGLIDEPSSSSPIYVLVGADRRVSVEPPIHLRRSRALDQRAHPARTPRRTRIEETVLDLCEECGSGVDVAGWVTRAVGRRQTTPARLRLALRGRSRHRWRALLSAMLDDVELGSHSPLELEYLRAVERGHRLPRGVRQQRVLGSGVRWVDVDVDEFTTRIELDGRLGHVGEGAFRDRQRDNAATRSGRATLRYGWGEVFGSACLVAAEVAQVLQARGWMGQPFRCGSRCALGVQRGRSGSS